MKIKFIDTIRIGDAVDDIFVLSEKNLRQKQDGANFLNVTLSDKTGRIKGVVWDNADRIAGAVNTDDFVRVRGSVSEYGGRLQLVLKDMEKCPRDAVNAADFIPATHRDVDAMFERLVKTGNNFLKAEHFKELLNAFWNDREFVSKFKTAPAAKKMHHAYIGGLLEHTLSMALLVEKISGHYAGVDTDMLFTGAILHDVGKVRELDYQFKIDYSDEGRLLNHIVIGCQMLDEKLREIKEFPQEHAMLLKHLIVSHHGIREFGSPEVPKTIEAVLLNYIDEIDAKVNGIRDFIAKEDSNESWTSYHKLFERHFYKGKK